MRVVINQPDKGEVKQHRLITFIEATYTNVVFYSGNDIVDEHPIGMNTVIRIYDDKEE